MPTRITERLSDIPKIDRAIDKVDKIAVSQSVNGVATTGITDIADLFNYLEDDVLKNGVGHLVSLGPGIVGNGTESNPIRVDKEVLDTILVPNDIVDLTQVGYRRTRFLPMARRRLFEVAGYRYGYHPVFPAINAENTGELRMIQGSNLGAYTAAISNWHVDKNADTSQIIERPYVFRNTLHPNSVSTMNKVLGVTGNAATGCIVLIEDRVTKYRTYWFARCHIGSLKDSGIMTIARMATDDPAYPTINHAMEWFENRTTHVVLDVNDTGYVFSPLPNGREIEVIQFTLTEATNHLPVYTKVRSWTSTTFAGTVTSTDKLVISNGGVVNGTAQHGDEIAITGDYTHTDSIIPGKSTHRIQVIQSKDDHNLLHLLSYKEHVITSGGVTKKYVLPIYAKITINGTTSGSCVGIGESLTGRPEITVSNGTFKENTEKFFPADNSRLVSEDYRFLTDGTLVVINDGYDGYESLVKLHQPEQFYFASTESHDLIKLSRSYMSPVTWSVTPEYHGQPENPGYKIFISSKIKVTHNGITYYIEPEIIDLNAHYNNAPTSYITGIANTDGRYDGKLAKVIYFYSDVSSGKGALHLTTTPWEENNETTLIAAFFIPLDGTSTILYGQAYSRFGGKRLSYEPSGSSVPVSYYQAYDAPTKVWGKKTSKIYTLPMAWQDRGMTIPAKYVVSGNTVVISANPGPAAIGVNFNLWYEGTSYGIQTCHGTPLLWHVKLSTSETEPSPRWFVVTSDSPNYPDRGNTFFAVPNVVRANFISAARSPISDQGIGTTTRLRVSSETLSEGTVLGCTLTVQSYTDKTTTEVVLEDKVFEQEPVYWDIEVDSMSSIKATVVNRTLNEVTAMDTLEVYQPIELELDYHKEIVIDDNGNTVIVDDKTLNLADYVTKKLGKLEVGYYYFSIPYAKGIETLEDFAITVGDFPEGSRISLDNYGWISGGIQGGNIPLNVYNFGRVLGNSNNAPYTNTVFVFSDNGGSVG